ncbi:MULTISPECIES: phage terminase large subunit [unclassified Bradyrhizobium]|uniref:phage terminase large subunit n=1 Tax=unclassified Bradyrhizobium TaxID=2631580 RepID=UPI0028EFBD83|nr:MULTISPECIES: phage terminase large subunit [unclassified Bradyrhizobium]
MNFVTDVSPEEAAAEILRRRRGREHLIDFTTYTLPKYYADPFHYKVAEALERVERGECKRLMIFAPPRHGKSELSTRRFPAWFMARNPSKNIISASYNGDFATGFGRNVRDIIKGKEFERLFPHIKIRPDIRAADEWQLTDESGGGQYYAVGVGTGTTGKGAHLFLIDDPIKDRKEVKSATFRDDQWDWYRDVVYTRLEEDAPIILTLTRWHYDDIAGRIIEAMEDGKGLPWEILYLPALPWVKKTPDGQLILNEDGTVPGDALGRKPNEPLAPNRFSYAALQDRLDVLGERSFSALYQQQPMSDDGGMFRADWFAPVAVAELPPRRAKVRAWDLAASSDGDYTVGVLMSKDSNGVFYIEHVIRFRGSPLEVEKKIQETAKNDGRSVQIFLPQDPGQAGKSQVQGFIRRLAGYIVKTARPTGSKEVRAAAFAAQAEAGNVKMVPGSWNTVFTDELETFPLGTYDDQVDAAADAFNSLLGPKRAAVLDW